jgi:hypothetical protein
MIEIQLLPAAYLAGATTFAIVANLLFYMMIGEINRKLPDDQQFSYLFMYWGKLGRITKEYQRLYPQSRLFHAMVACGALTFAFLLGLMWSIGFFQ